MLVRLFSECGELTATQAKKAGAKRLAILQLVSERAIADHTNYAEEDAVIRELFTRVAYVIAAELGGDAVTQVTVLRAELDAEAGRATVEA